MSIPSFDRDRLRALSGAREHGATAAIAIRSVVALESFFAVPIRGASMNPARSLAPAFVSGATRDAWVCVAAPVTGTLLAVPFRRLLRTPGCCPAEGGCS